MNPINISEASQVNRRGFISGVTAGLACGALSQAHILNAQSPAAAVKRHLYVTNNAKQRVDIYDIVSEESFQIQRQRFDVAASDVMTHR